MEKTVIGEDEMLVLMGHGTDHHANSAYPTLEYTFHSLGYQQVLVGTVESFPDLRNVMAKLEISGRKKVVLMPFMFVAGDHAKMIWQEKKIHGKASWRKKDMKSGLF